MHAGADGAIFTKDDDFQEKWNINYALRIV